MAGARTNKVEINDKLKERVRGLYAQGFTQLDIAKRIGLCQNVIGRILRGER